MAVTRKMRRGWSHICAGASGLAMMIAVQGMALANPEVTAIRFGEGENSTRIVVETSEPVDFQAFTMAEPGPRLVMELPEALWGVANLATGEGAGRGHVSNFRFISGAGGRSRLVFNLTGPSQVSQTLNLEPGESGNYRQVIDIATAEAAVFQASSSEFPTSTSIDQLVAERAHARYDAGQCGQIRVVIDAGHGGRDPGAAASHGGHHESQVNLAAALALRDILLATGRYEVVMTRDSDVFIELEDRIRIAQDADADLFISLHADAVASGSSARGATVYTLADRAVNRARNRALDHSDGFLSNGYAQPVQDLLLDMSLREKRNQSLVFAQDLINRVDGMAPVLDERPRQANFYVLLDSQVPAVLFEMGFLTNRDDAHNLNNARFRQRLMATVAESIDHHFERCHTPNNPTYTATLNRSSAAQ